MGVSNAWAGTYYYSGQGNGTNWSKKAMTVSDDGFYEYYLVSSTTTHQFKIGTASNQYAYNKDYVSKNFNGTNIANIGDYGGDNCYCWQGSKHYILVYKPNTTINTSSNPKICAATYLPDNRECTVYFVNKDSWNSVNAYGWYYQNNTDGSNNGWPGKAMTNTGKTYNGKQIWSYTYPQTYDKAIFNNGSGQTSDLTLGTTNKGKMYDYPNSKWIDYTYDVTVTFNANGHGTAPAAKTVLKGGKVSAPAAPTATGYTFDGWYKESNCANAFDFNTAINADITLYAKWTAKTYTVTLNNQGATTAGATSVTATYGSAMPSIASNLPKKTGYTFNGYYDATSGGTQYYKADGSSARTWNKTAATTLYAQWTANKYNITYKDQGNVAFSGTNKANLPAQHTYGTATTLVNGVKTGYTFGGWFTTQDCSGTAITSLGATAYTAAITLYAKWTANQYTLTYIAGAGGTVTATTGGQPIYSPATLNYGTSVTLTATPDGENAFAQWVDADGVKISSDNPYTFTFTESKTIKAEFSTPTTVYLVPGEGWKQHNAHFAIYSWGGASADTWVEVESADCEGTYYKADVPAGFSDFAFVRLKPVGADGYSTENNGYNWDNKWEQSGNLSIPTDGSRIYEIQDKTQSYIHLKPNENWKQDNARFAAYFYGNGEKWISLTKNGTDVYSCKKPEGYTHVIFCRLPNDVENTWNNTWNKTIDLALLDNGDQCFEINNNNGWGCNGNGQGNDEHNNKGADGTWFRLFDDSQWKNYTPSFTVTLEPSQYGYYTVDYNGRTYKSLDKDTVRFKATVGSTIKINDGVPYNSAYTNDIILQQSTKGTILQHVQNTTHTVCGHTAIDENFVTKTAHKVYLAIPKTLESTWNSTGNNNYVYSQENMTNGHSGVLTQMTPITPSEFCANTNYIYYTCEVPAGCHTFCFERKASNAETARQSYTGKFKHALPLADGNCYTLTGKVTDDGTEFTGYWSMPPADGDYRLIYVEQVVQKSENSGEDWKTIVKRTKCHPSDIVRKNTAATTSESVVSLHVYKKGQNPEVILQQFSCAAGDWVDIEAHMVNGPLETTPNMGMLPGRKNAGSNSDVDDFVYDNGIERIKNDTEKDGRVWNFTIKQYNNGDKATLILDDNTKFYPYEGQYYIRTLDALGGWIDYTIPANYVNYSHYADTAGYFTHYFCKYIHENTDVTFVIANDYGQAITDTLYIDRDFYGKVLANPMVGATGKLPAQDANVRFSWDEETNITSRAYIAGAYEGLNEYLVVEGDNITIPDITGDKDNYFRDNTNWLYYIDINAKTTAQATVKAKYNSVYQYFRGTDSAKEPLIGGSNADNTSYPIRILYDFKEHRFIIAYRPPTTIQGDVAIETPVMIIRKNHEAPNQITFNSNERTITAPMPAYAVMTFVENFLKDASKTKQEKMLYWVSFPFDVKIQDVFGLGNYGTHWVMEYYDGQQRAIEGLNIYNTFWRYITDTEETLQAGKGYVLCLNVDRIVGETFLDGNNAEEEISLYFPSAEAIDESTIKSQGAQTVNIPTWTGAAEEKDHNWNLIGVISYANTGESTQQSNTNFLYEYDASSDTYNARTSSGYTFNALHAYMVQYGGDISWTSHIAPQAIAAKHNTYGTSDKYILCLDLINKGKTTDQTFIQLQEEDATAMFDLNQDMMKIFNSGANIYSIANTNNGPYELAGNALPVEETIIPLGLKLDAAGEYTFSMPQGTDNIVVELIDYENNTRTNMLLDDYTVTLPAGTNHTRFAIHVQPNKVTTSVGDINSNSNGVKKFLINGQLFMKKDGVLYDAQGKLVR